VSSHHAPAPALPRASPPPLLTLTKNGGRYARAGRIAARTRRGRAIAQGFTRYWARLH
jgi:hypothetical protein